MKLICFCALQSKEKYVEQAQCQEFCRGIEYRPKIGHHLVRTIAAWGEMNFGVGQ